MKIHLIAGARPNFMKIAPIMRELDRHPQRFSAKVVHTGQHYDKDMSDVFFAELGIPRPQHHLEVGSGSHAEQTAKIIVRYEQICLADRPDQVLVVGDVNSTLACSIVARKLGIEVGHVEAGLRSGDLSMPEEINRLATDSISNSFFVTEPSGLQNLLREGKPQGCIHFVGHVMIDNLFHQLKILNQSGSALERGVAISARHRDFGVVTLHRPANVDDPETLGRILSALARVSERIPLIFPAHPRTAQRIRECGINLPASITLTGPMPYMAFLSLWKDSRLVLTDSGGLQEETTALGIPCVTLRDNTERPVTITEGTNVLAGRDPARILAAALAALELERGGEIRRPALWDGRAAERIVEVLAAAAGPVQVAA